MFYLANKELWENDSDWNGFKWIVCDDSNNNVIAFRRIASNKSEIICITNFCPVLQKNYRIGVPDEGIYKPVLNSDKKIYGGEGVRIRKIKSVPIKSHGFEQSISVTIPPLSTVYYKKEG